MTIVRYTAHTLGGMPMSCERYVLGLDAGGSALKWVILNDAGRRVAGGNLGPLTASLLLNGTEQQVLSELAKALPHQPAAIVAGFSGMSKNSAQVTQVARLISQSLGLDDEHIQIVSDLELAYHAHWQPGQGILLYAGTGSMALHIAQNGDFIRAGGYGYKIGDDGAGFSLGRAALRWLTHSLDTVSDRASELQESVLANEIKKITGGLDWETLRAYVYSEPGAATVAAMAPAVGRAADQGDQVALGFLQEACDSLVQLVKALSEWIGPLPVVATGGVFRIGSAYQDCLQQALPQIVVQQRDHAEYAAQWALTKLRN